MILTIKCHYNDMINLCFPTTTKLLNGLTDLLPPSIIQSIMSVGDMKTLSRNRNLSLSAGTINQDTFCENFIQNINF